MKHIPLHMIETWLFLARATDKKLGHAKFVANNKIKQHFGSIALAELYIEQQKDKKIEVVVI